MRGLLFSESYRPLFSGHETFSLRQLWLKKAVDLVSADGASQPSEMAEQAKRSKNIFTDNSSIVSLGVGKNMVAAIRHWSTACDVLAENNGIPYITEFGSEIYSCNGLDPYSEHPSTLWLTHWKLAGGWAMATQRTHRSATWFWVFNYIHEQTFTQQGLLSALSDYANSKNVKISAATLKRDIEVFLRCYVSRSEANSMDDFADSMLGELGLIGAQHREEYSLRRGPKTTLNDGAFLYALVEFWQKFAPTQSTLSFEAIAYEIGSPGRVFKLDEDSIAAKLLALDEMTGDRYQWSDSSGLRQVICRIPLSLSEVLRLAYV